MSQLKCFKFPRFLQNLHVPALFVVSVSASIVGTLSGGGVQRHTIEDFHVFEEQEVEIGDFEAQGYILDIGGGGEGLIGQLKGSQVIAIDISQRELEDAPPGPLKIVMDGRDLKFLDSSFGVATSCYTLMYIADEDHPKVFSEVYRVLVPGGSFLIWDALFPERGSGDKELALFKLKFRLPNKVIQTGYGVHWPLSGRQLSRYTQLAESVGFKVELHNHQDSQFFLRLRKPS